MWRNIILVLTLVSLYHPTKAQTLTENLVTGNWYVVRWETNERLLDFEDSVASLKLMVENFKRKNKVYAVQRADSLHIRRELSKILSIAEAIRFRLYLNKDKSFLWTANNDAGTAQYKGTYSISPGNQQIVLTSLDGKTKAYQTIPLKLHAIQSNQMIIEIPSEEPGFKQSKFTLKRMTNY